MFGSRRHRWSILACAVLALSCTRPREGATTPTVPVGSLAPTVAPSATVGASPSPSPTPTPVPTATPQLAPRVTLAAPVAGDDFASADVDVIFTVQAPTGTQVESVSIAYNGVELKSLAGPGPNFRLDGWNPGVKNSFAGAGDPLPAGPQVLTVTAKLDTGATGKTELKFEKPLTITGWTELARMPGATSHLAVHSDGAAPPSFMTLWGSIDGRSAPVAPRTQIFSFNPMGAGSWTTARVTGSSVARAGYAHVANPDSGVVYLAGGRAGSADMRELDVFTPLRKVAETTSSRLEQPRRYAAAAFYDGQLYVFGGEALSAALYSVERVSIAKTDGYPDGDWEARADMLTARVGATASVQGKEIWVFGGGFKPVEVYDPAKDEWRFLTNAAGLPIGAPEAWAHAAMVTVGDRLFFFGGVKEDGQPIERIYEFNAKHKTWRDVGPLPEIEGLDAVDRPEANMGAFFWDGAFFLVGGRSLPDGKVSDRVFKGATF